MCWQRILSSLLNANIKIELFGKCMTTVSHSVNSNTAVFTCESYSTSLFSTEQRRLCTEWKEIKSNLTSSQARVCNIMFLE